MPSPVLHRTLVTTFFSSFLVFYLLFFNQNWPLGCPPGWMPGPSHRPHPPLHDTVLSFRKLISHAISLSILMMTSNTTTVVIAGNFKREVGCSKDLMILITK